MLEHIAMAYEGTVPGCAVWCLSILAILDIAIVFQICNSKTLAFVNNIKDYSICKYYQVASALKPTLVKCSLERYINHQFSTS